jgi:hypothetical protein
MRLLALCFQLLIASTLPGAVLADSQGSLELSKTMVLKWPSALNIRPLYMAKSGFFIFNGKIDGIPFEGQVWRKTPLITATANGIERYWGENRRLASQTTKQLDLDGGCKTVRSGTYICRRTATIDKKHPLRI